MTVLLLSSFTDVKLRLRNIKYLTQTYTVTIELTNQKPWKYFTPINRILVNFFNLKFKIIKLLILHSGRAQFSQSLKFIQCKGSYYKKKSPSILLSTQQEGISFACVSSEFDIQHHEKKKVKTVNKI